MEYNFRKIEFHDRKKLTKLIDTSFGLKTIHKLSLVDWKFFSPLKTDLCAYGAFSGKGELVSFYSDKNIPIKFSDRVFKTAICLDMCTHPDHRRKGLITKLSKLVYRDLRRYEYDFSFGFSNENGIKVDKYASDYGYKIVGQFETFRKVLFFPKKVSGFVIKKARTIKNHGGKIKYFQIDANTDYLKWRYLSKFKLKNYFIYNVYKDKKIVGTLIASENRRSIGLLKIVVDKEENFKTVIEVASSYFFKQGKIYLTVTVLTNKFWKELFRKTGFLPYKQKENYYLTVLSHKYNDKNLLDPNSWLLMGGDLM